MKWFIALLLTVFFGSTSAQWQPCNSGVTRKLNDVFFVDANMGFACGDSGIIIGTTNAGASWSNLSSGVSTNLQAICFTSAQTGYACGTFGTIIKTGNGGQNWQPLNSGITLNLNSLCFPTPNTGVAVGESGTIIRTNDYGNSWVLINSPTVYILNTVVSSSPLVVYAAGNSGELIKSADGGLNWVPEISGTTENLFGASFTNNSTGIVVGDHGTAVETTGSSIWNALTVGTNLCINDCYWYNGGARLLCSDAGKIFSDTVANSWLSDSVAGQPNLNAMYFTDQNTGYAVGSGGNIFKIANAALTSPQLQESLNQYFSFYVSSSNKCNSF